ncbi:MAG: rhamnulokinase [Bacteroidaceae bacterium]|nr:rhamnulokinase [Bacteroidaceae bacterium]
MKDTYLAADFGGGSGRVLAGYMEGGELQLEEIYRFRNRQVRIGRHLYWDFPSLFEDMKTGIRKAAQRGDLNIRSIGIDTWGVDFGFVDARGNLLGLPVCYRDERTAGLCRKFQEEHDAKAHYAKAGIQMMDINSIYQLIAMRDEGSPILETAAHLLFMPDLFSFFLTGQANCEYSIASTSELLDARSRSWNLHLIDELGLRREMFPPIIMPGTVRGTLMPEVAREVNLSPDVKVVAVASHDTQSASYVVPDGYAFLSSGTWSLLGVTLDEPVLTEEARLAGCSNEGAVGGRINFLQNITGLWFLQRLMAEWKERGNKVGFDVALPAAEAAETDTVVDVDDPIFANPDSMEKAIAEYCHKNNLKAPCGVGEHVRVVFQSLAQRYARGIREFNRLLPHPITRINIIGGGCKNDLLNRLTAEATGLEVIAGPVEATGMGNIMVQMRADT